MLHVSYADDVTNPAAVNNHITRSIKLLIFRLWMKIARQRLVVNDLEA